MSLNSLASSRVARQVATRQQVRRAGTGTSEDAVPPGEDVQNALSALVEYVPTETITLYLATLSAVPVLVREVAFFNADRVYWMFAILTPILYGLIYIGKRRSKNLPPLPTLGEWPWWPTVAATVAFLAWGLAVPQSPYLEGEGGRVIAGLVAIFASALLGILGKVFGPADEDAS